MNHVRGRKKVSVSKGIYNYFGDFITLTEFLSPGLFESHKLLFSFNMTIKIEQAEGRVPQEELEFFIKGELFREVQYSTYNSDQLCTRKHNVQSTFPSRV